jgi:predicted dehydrogenase
MQNLLSSAVAVYGAAILIISATYSCQSPTAGASRTDTVRKPVRLITLDPGHFHAALVQKSMYEEVDPVVHVYAPAGPDVQLHLDRIRGYNSREKDPTHWAEEVYTGTDFFPKMIVDKPGNTVVLSGNNREKADYILGSLRAGLNVLADKPMVIDSAGFALLQQAFDTAASQQLLLYDIMTERFEITTILQREFSKMGDVFGTQEKGTAAHPGVVMESVHHIYKQVSGKTLTRPPWFFDVKQQGEGIADVMTHLVDLVQWECFPEQALDYTKDVQVDAARHWGLYLDWDQFDEITGMHSYPNFIADHDTSGFFVYCNGEIQYRLRGIHVRTTATWSYKDPLTADDTYYSLLRGTRANLVIRQGAEEKFKPTLSIEPSAISGDYEKKLQQAITDLQSRYPGISLERSARGWKIAIPESYKEGHEAHFARVMRNFLDYLKQRQLPAWERPNMLAKYYTTTRALEMSRRTQQH